MQIYNVNKVGVTMVLTFTEIDSIPNHPSLISSILLYYKTLSSKRQVICLFCDSTTDYMNTICDSTLCNWEFTAINAHGGVISNYRL